MTKLIFSMSWLKQAQSHVKHLCPVYLQFPQPPKKMSPAALIWSNSSHSCLLEEGSMPLVGSSKKTTGVSPSRAVATHSRRFCPPERVVHWSSTFSGIPNQSRSHQAQRPTPQPLIFPAHRSTHAIDFKEILWFGFLSQSWCIYRYIPVFFVNHQQFQDVDFGGKFSKEWIPATQCRQDLHNPAAAALLTHSA